MGIWKGEERDSGFPAKQTFEPKPGPEICAFYEEGIEEARWLKVPKETGYRGTDSSPERTKEELIISKEADAEGEKKRLRVKIALFSWGAGGFSF